ncbi:hypothetical protein ACVWXL_008037 [Bradyrhizobium sp. GM22.5]
MVAQIGMSDVGVHASCSQFLGAARAFSEDLNKLSIGEVLPVLRLGEQVPVSVRMVRGALSTQRRHRAQSAYSFHSLSSRCFYFSPPYFVFLRHSHHDYELEIFLSFSDRQSSELMARFLRTDFRFGFALGFNARGTAGGRLFHA